MKFFNDPLPIGPLESEVIEVMRRIGQATVGEVLAGLPKRLPYTTVMSAMGQLVEKGVLLRNAKKMPFHYELRFSREELRRERVRRFIESFSSGPKAGLDALHSSLIDRFGHDTAFWMNFNPELTCVAKPWVADGPRVRNASRTQFVVCPLLSWVRGRWITGGWTALPETTAYRHPSPPPPARPTASQSPQHALGAQSPY
jgi:predicted transcriptional regulator